VCVCACARACVHEACIISGYGSYGCGQGAEQRSIAGPGACSAIAPDFDATRVVAMRMCNLSLDIHYTTATAAEDWPEVNTSIHLHYTTATAAEDWPEVNTSIHLHCTTATAAEDWPEVNTSIHLHYTIATAAEDWPEVNTSIHLHYTIATAAEDWPEVNTSMLCRRPRPGRIIPRIRRTDERADQSSRRRRPAGRSTAPLHARERNACAAESAESGGLGQDERQGPRRERQIRAEGRRDALMQAPRTNAKGLAESAKSGQRAAETP
jgi:uncharacterized beta-barrel protein YwiB (DUF1934 family)